MMESRSFIPFKIFLLFIIPLLVRNSTALPRVVPEPPPIPVLPAICDPNSITEDCVAAMKGEDGEGGYIWFDTNSGCTKDVRDPNGELIEQGQQTMLHDTLWDVHNIAYQARNFPNWFGLDAGYAAGYWMGPDWTNPPYFDRVQKNLNRVFSFQTRDVPATTYITISCRDTRGICGNQGVGGYGWTSEGIFWDSHFITFCPTFFNVSRLAEVEDEVLKDLARGSTKMADDMAYLNSKASLFFHELTHTKLVYQDRGKIVDQYLNPRGEEGTHGHKAYTPWGVRSLATRPISKGGGASRATLNADSYTMLASTAYWHQVTGYFPRALTQQRKRPPHDTPKPPTLMLHADIGRVHASTIDFSALFEAEIATGIPLPPEELPKLLGITGPQTGQSVAGGMDLRILTIGDSITVGYRSNTDGGDGNGYRRKLRNNLSQNNVVFAGTETMGAMPGNYYAAWSGQTIQYMFDHVDNALAQNPNLVLLHAGTNDMHSDPSISKQGNDPTAAAMRLGTLLDKIWEACPDAVILVAKIMNMCSSGDAAQHSRTLQYQTLITETVEARKVEGRKIQTVDFSGFSESDLRDCYHPTNGGYDQMGEWWYDYLTQIPTGWFTVKEGPDPDHPQLNLDPNANGGIDQAIPAPFWGPDPVTPSSSYLVGISATAAGNGGNRVCNSRPQWHGTGQIAHGFGSVGTWQWNKLWTPATTINEGPVALGLGLDPQYVRLADMNGDGKADYVWVHPETGETTCWLNNLPGPWSPAGTNGGIIASGVGPAARIYLADLNGDRLADYICVDPEDGSLDVYWNRGYDPSWENGWRFEPHNGPNGVELAVGVPHANLATLRFPDINGDGRADYVYVGSGGSLAHWLNTGSEGGTDVLFRAQGGIATGPGVDISRVVFADVNGDGRDDYLVWEESTSVAGLSGFLNQATRNDGVPVFIDQGGAKSIADGITQDPSKIRLADMNGDRFDDYVFVDDNNGALWVWNNNAGTGPTHMQIDSLRFADIDGDGIDDYVYLDPLSNAPTVFLNKGASDTDSLGWNWDPLNNAQPIAAGVGTAKRVVFGDIDGDGKDDYLALNPENGALEAYLNKGPSNTSAHAWDWLPIGQLASGFGTGFPAANVRIADIDGDGKDDYIYVHGGGATTIYRNRFGPGASPPFFEPLPAADASGIFQRGEEITFTDIDGDGKADYVWTRSWDGGAEWYKNNYPNSPTWLPMGEIAGGVGTGGQNIRYAKLQNTGRASYIAVNPTNGAIAAWLNGCTDLGSPNGRPVIEIVLYRTLSPGAPIHYVYQWKVIAETPQAPAELCQPTAAKTEPAANIDPYTLPIPFPPTISNFAAHGFSGCTYSSVGSTAGTLDCPGREVIQCTEDFRSRTPVDCGGTPKIVFVPKVVCHF